MPVSLAVVVHTTIVCVLGHPPHFDDTTTVVELEYDPGSSDMTIAVAHEYECDFADTMYGDRFQDDHNTDRQCNVGFWLGVKMAQYRVEQHGLRFLWA
jgi:hypothetical protein